MNYKSFEDLGDYINQLKNYNKSEEENVSEFEKRSRGLARAYKMVNPLSNNEFEKLMIKLLGWEEDYEDMWYKKGVETTSNLFDSVFEIAQELGCDLPNNEYFSAYKFSYKDFIFEMFSGQGCYYRVSHKYDDNIYFQST